MKYYKCLNNEMRFTAYINGRLYKNYYKEGLNDFTNYNNNMMSTFYREDILIDALSITSYYISEVTIPKGIKPYKLKNGYNCWNAKQIILSEPRIISVDVIKELIQSGADINIQNDLPIRSAIYGHSYEVTKLLLENVKNRPCLGPLIRANDYARNNQLTSIEILLTEYIRNNYPENRIDTWNGLFDH